jgi:hypothetical protein
MRSGCTPMISDAEWPIHSSRLKRRAELAERALEFGLDKPAGDDLQGQPARGHMTHGPESRSSE